MKNNNVRKSGLAIAMAAAMGASAGANAAVELYNQDGTSFSGFPHQDGLPAEHYRF